MAQKNSKNLQKNVKLPIEIWSFYNWLYGAQKHSQFFDRKKIHKFLFIFLKEFDRKFYKIETVPLSNFVFR